MCSSINMINLCIGDQLTTISCGHVIVELIKFMAYQRFQIPYSYQWLKQVVNKMKTSENQDFQHSLRSETHFRIVSTALENLDFILKSLLCEINGPDMPEEVCLVLGGAPVTCKEVYRILLPLTCHKPQCHSKHIASDQKIHHMVFQKLATSEQLSKVFSNQISPTNMFVFIKKKCINQDMLLNNENFVLANDCRMPKSSKIIVINLRSINKDNVLCCDGFKIFDDVENNRTDNEQDKFVLEENGTIEDSLEFNEIESTDKFRWYQSCYVMKGFKDYAINGSSITNTWLKS